MKKRMKLAGLLFVWIFPFAVNAGDYTCITNSGTITITGITVPAEVTCIERRAFGSCSGLTSITVDTLNSDYCSVDGVLYNETATQLLKYPGGKMGSLAIPNSVTHILDFAFSGCKGLTSITIPSGVTRIGDGAFDKCLGLKGSLTIPAGVTFIGYDAFGYCSGLTGIYFQSDAPTLGGNFVCNGSPATIYRVSDAAGWPTVPDTWAGRPTALWDPDSDEDADGLPMFGK